MNASSARGKIYALLYHTFSGLSSMDWGSDELWMVELARLMSHLPELLSQAARGQTSYERALEIIKERTGNRRTFDYVVGAVENEHQWHPGTVEDLLHRLLYCALIEIRMKAYEVENSKAFRLADIMHNAPLQMIGTSQGKTSCDDVLENLRERATRHHAEDWINNALSQSVDW
jgi:hypothetical protein